MCGCGDFLHHRFVNPDGYGSDASGRVDERGALDELRADVTRAMLAAMAHQVRAVLVAVARAWTRLSRFVASPGW